MPDGPLPDPETPAPPRFLPEYDNVLLSHADRSRVAARADVSRVFTKGGLLVDGFLAGRWGLKSERKRPRIELELFRRLTRPSAQTVDEEGERLRRSGPDPLT